MNLTPKFFIWFFIALGIFSLASTRIITGFFFQTFSFSQIQNVYASASYEVLTSIAFFLIAIFLVLYFKEKH